MLTICFIQNLSVWEIVIVLAIILLFFGSRLPGLGKALGRSIMEFKGGIKEGQKANKEDAEKAVKEEENEQTRSK